MNIYDLKNELLEIAKVQAQAETHLLERNNVTGVAIGPKVSNGRETGDMGLTVFVASKLTKEMLDKDSLIPATIGKFKTDVVETGVLTAGSVLENKDRFRPVWGGVSVGHPKVTAGTVGCCVKDINPAVGITPRYYILSNNHVLANSNEATIGDPILQPGRIDGGLLPEDVVAHLSRFVPINFSGGANLVDCAIAEGNFHVLNREIYWVGHVNGMAHPSLGQLVYKTGRTTGHTSGKITSINATVSVNYGGGKVALFKNQITTTAMSQGGDSGSLIVNEKNQAVGLLFAGSSSITIANPIAPVMSMLGIKFV